MNERFTIEKARQEMYKRMYAHYRPELVSCEHIANVAAEIFSRVAPEPEVIVGDGKTPMPDGCYAFENENDYVGVVKKTHGAYGDKNTRYIRLALPTFPPRPAPLPPKPEQHLYRVVSGIRLGHVFWGGLSLEGRLVVDHGDGTRLSLGDCERMEEPSNG